MQSTKSLFNKIKNRIQSNPIFSRCIYYSSSQQVTGTPYITITLDNDDKIYACANAYLSENNQVIDFDLTKAFLSKYTYREVLKMSCGAFTCMVIYEIQEDNFS